MAQTGRKVLGAERDDGEVRDCRAGEYGCAHKVNTSNHALNKSKCLHVLPRS